MNLIPITPGLLWLLDSTDPKDYIAGLPDNWRSQSPTEQQLSFMGMESQGSNTWYWQRGPWVIQLMPILSGYHLQVYNKETQDVVDDGNYSGHVKRAQMLEKIAWYMQRVEAWSDDVTEAIDPKDFIAKVPDDYDMLDEVEEDLDKLGFVEDAALQPRVWNLHIGPLAFQAYKVHASTTMPVWHLEVRRGNMMLKDEKYVGGEARQIPGDVRQAIQTYRDVGLLEAVDPKEFIASQPSVREFLEQQYRKYDPHLTVDDAEMGIRISFQITATVATVHDLVRKISETAGVRDKPYCRIKSLIKPGLPQRRQVAVVYLGLP